MPENKAKWEAIETIAWYAFIAAIVLIPVAC